MLRRDPENASRLDGQADVAVRDFLPVHEHEIQDELSRQRRDDEIQAADPPGGQAGRKPTPITAAARPPSGIVIQNGRPRWICARATV